MPTDPESRPAVPSRRRLLQGGAVATGAAAAAALAPAATAHAAGPASGGQWPLGKGRFRTRLVLLGTAGGPVPNADRFGISTALVVGDRTYLFDAGRGSVSQYVRAGLEFKRLRGMFVTHLHADHTADLFQYLLLGLVSPDGDALVPPIDLYGPGRAGALPPQWGKPRPTPNVNPDNPTPGLKDLFADSLDGFAYHFNILGREANMPDPSKFLRIHEIDVSGTGANPIDDLAPKMAPIKLFSDGTITVETILVSHGLVFPAFAYRVTTPDGVVVFSGDTGYNENLIAFSRGADVLVHEAVSVGYYKDKGSDEAFIKHLEEGHTDVVKVGEAAARAGVGTLVLSHLGPARSDMVSDREWRKGARTHFKGDLVVGRDLMNIGVRHRRHHDH